MYLFPFNNFSSPAERSDIASGDLKHLSYIWIATLDLQNCFKKNTTATKQKNVMLTSPYFNTMTYSTSFAAAAGVSSPPWAQGSHLADFLLLHWLLSEE